MEELFPPVKIHHSRKRKKTLPSSTPSHLIGSLTRSKSRIYFHQNRSGTSRPDPIRSKSDSFYPDPVEASTDPIPCNNSPRISSVKDLRIRRVFTPDVNSVHHQEEEEEEVNDENENRKKLLKCTDSDSYLGDVKLDELEKSEVIEIGSKTEDAFEIGLNLNHQGISENGSDSNTKMAEDAQNDFEIGLNLNHQGISENGPDSNTIMAEEAQNDFENGLNGISENGFDSNTKMAEDAQNEFEIGLNLNHQGISEIGSNSNTKMALNRCRRRKVFKTSSSFSYKRMLPYLMDISNDDSSVTKIKIVEAVIPSKLQKFDSVKSEMMSLAKSSGTQFDDTNPSNTKMPIDQEPVQMTPPDPSIFTDTEVDHGVSDKQILKGSNEKSNGNVSSTNSIYGSVHNPRSRVFNNPGSLSYRRLLPFLMNISQNNTCDTRVTQQAMPLVDKEKDTVEKDDVSETIIEKQPTGDQTQDYSPPSNGSSLEFNNDLVNPMVSNGEPSLEPLMAINLDVEKMPPSDTDHEEVELSVGMKEICIEPGPVEKDSGPVEKESRPVEKEPEPVGKMPPSDNETSNEQATSKEPGPVEKEKVCSDMGLEPYNNNNNNVAPISSVEAMVSPAICSFKGILKRNPRGCRGLCNCLNCASFRLHADRAFEFSRNQMQDAEEVASDLMKELAKLRCLMEKSIIRDDNDNLAGIQLNPPLVKEACNKALEAENLAKGRLNQLNYDLNVHCRIPMLLEPKVSFSNSRIQENAIPVTDSFAASPEKKG